MFWAVAVLEPQGQRKASLNAMRQGFETYLPKVLTVDKRGFPKVTWMFPGYMFVKVENGQWNVLRSTYGILDMICFGSQVGKLPPYFIPGLRDQEIEWEDDVRVIDIRTDRQKGPQFVKNDVVRAVGDHPFAGLVGVVSECTASRVKALFELMGRKVPVVLAPSQVALV